MIAEPSPSPSHLGLLASAVAGRPLLVATGSEQLAHTDGQTIWVAPAAAEDVRASVVVQAALLAAGSLEHRTVAKLRGRPASRRRYLTLEAARAAATLGTFVPPAVRARLAEVYDGPLTGSALESLRGADARGLPEAPSWMGDIRPGRIVVAPLEAGDGRRSRLMELLAAPIGSKALGDLLHRLLGLEPTREDGPPSSGGGEEITGGGNRGPSDRTGSVKRRLGTARTPPRGDRYPEWHTGKGRYREGWCSVAELEPHHQDGLPAPLQVDRELLRRLARVGLVGANHRRQDDGDELDLTALVEHQIDARTGAEADHRVFEARRPSRHDLGVLVLLDATGSTGDWAGGMPVFEAQRAVAGRLTAAFDRLGVRVAAFGFHSYGRDAVEYLRVKSFDAPFDLAARRRLASLEPSGFTRLGAVVRHGTRMLTTRAGTTRMLLVLIGDGLPYDDGYAHEYAIADTHRALAEAVAQGVGCACVSVGEPADRRIIDAVWGHVAHRELDEPGQIVEHARDLVGEALRAAAARRRPITERTIA
jgi:hypothetical protein